MVAEASEIKGVGDTHVILMFYGGILGGESQWSTSKIKDGKWLDFLVN